MSDKKEVKLYILVGPPASGKSTWGKNFAAEKGITYVSTDAIRAEIGFGEADQSVSRAAFDIAVKRVSQSLGEKKDTMIDATSINRKIRKRWTKLGKGHGARLIAVAFEVPQEELFKRNSLRERKVREEIIDMFVKNYQRPTTSEVNEVILIK